MEKGRHTKAKAPPPEKSKKPAGKGKKKISKAKKIILIIAIIVAVLAAAVCAAGVYVTVSDGIFPNVRVDGVAVGGLSTEEAQRKLADLGWDSDGENAVTYLLPLDNRVTVTAAEAGTARSSEKAATLAYESCHGGSIFSNLVRYVRCLTGEMELDSTSEANRAVVSAKVETAARTTKDMLMGCGVETGEESISVVKGASAVTIDEQALTGAIVSDLEERRFGEREFEVTIEDAQPLDIDALYEGVYREAQDAYYDSELGGIREAVIGLDFDRELARELWESAGYGDTVEIPLITTEPSLTTEQAEAMLFRDTLGTNTTSLSGSAASRKNNVKLACAAIDGLVLKPGETFSYNDTLGQRTEERGYMAAGAYSAGEVVQEVGGGICQVSSTLYYSALLANLKINTRSCHYFPVSYILPGLDATVSWGGPEFKFTNTRDWPVKIEASVDETESYVTVSILGTDLDGSYVVMTYTTWEVFNNEEYPETATGYRAATYRHVYDKNGNELSSNTESYSEYHYHEEDIVYPTPSPSPSLGPEPAVTQLPEPENPGEDPIPVPSDPTEPVEG